MEQKNAFWDKFVKTYQLIVRNEDDFEEKGSYKVSYARLTLIFSVVFVCIFSLSIFAVNRLLAKWFHPTYIERENQRKIGRLSKAVDDLALQLDRQNKFITLLQNIASNKIPSGEVMAAYESLKYEVLDYLGDEDQKKIVDLARSATSLKKSVQTTSNLVLKRKSKDAWENLLLFKPVRSGTVTKRFNANESHYGVDIVAKENEPIKSIASGVVMFSSWTVDTGWVIMVQHENDNLSVYKHNATLLKKAGDFVQGGEVIAIMGGSGDLATGPHLHLELWYNGIAVDPQKYISF